MKKMKKFSFVVLLLTTYFNYSMCLYFDDPLSILEETSFPSHNKQANRPTAQANNRIDIDPDNQEENALSISPRIDVWLDIKSFESLIENMSDIQTENYPYPLYGLIDNEDTVLYVNNIIYYHIKNYAQPQKLNRSDIKITLDPIYQPTLSIAQKIIVEAATSGHTLYDVISQCGYSVQQKGVQAKDACFTQVSRGWDFGTSKLSENALKPVIQGAKEVTNHMKDSVEQSITHLKNETLELSDHITENLDKTVDHAQDQLRNNIDHMKNSVEHSTKEIIDYAIDKTTPAMENTLINAQISVEQSITHLKNETLELSDHITENLDKTLTHAQDQLRNNIDHMSNTFAHTFTHSCIKIIAAAGCTTVGVMIAYKILFNNQTKSPLI